MRYRHSLNFIAVILFICTINGILSPAQYREYYVYGKVVDSDNQPLAAVKISLRDVNTSRSYRFSTNKKGEFKIVGLPHGIYQATIQKEGYRSQTNEWDFNTPQDRMQKVEMQTIILVSEEQIELMERAKQAKEELEEATAKVRQGDFDGAITVLNKMLADNPDDENAQYLLGINFYKKNELDEAIKAFTRVTELSPTFPPAYHYLGLCYQNQKEPEKALIYYEKNLELEPDRVDTLYNMGLILFGLSRIPEALVRFEKALELKPNDPELLEMAGRCYINQQEYVKAIEHLQKAKDASSDQDKINFLDQLISRLKELIKIS
ncbi:MAG: tetratricopeptide repeat protein [Candidatus Aminicenantes bacterium]|nr:tetratricopeptide repeat protein [Candidatus Aminicenantes bacterium]